MKKKIKWRRPEPVFQYIDEEADLAQAAAHRAAVELRQNKVCTFDLVAVTHNVDAMNPKPGHILEREFKEDGAFKVYYRGEYLGSLPGAIRDAVRAMRVVYNFHFTVVSGARISLRLFLKALPRVVYRIRTVEPRLPYVD